jgi:glycosyltransferase involved in cell wall biosynthesis
MQPAKLHALMAAADVFVMPSLYEEWGYVVVEALLSGTSVAAYPVHPFPDMLAGELGAIAAARTPAALAHALERCLTTPPPADLAQRAADRFGSEAIGDRLRAIYRGAVADHAAADPAASPTPQEVA